MDSVYIYNEFGELVSYDFWLHLSELIEWVCQNWLRLDEGISEVRGGAQEFSLLVRDVLGGSGLLHDVFILEREMPRARMTLGYASYLGLYAE